MDMSTQVGIAGLALAKGITPAGTGKAGRAREVVWSILGHTYWLKAECDGCFIFETLDPPGTFVPPHIHPTQDEFIYMLEGTFDLYLDGSWLRPRPETSCAFPEGCRTPTITSRTSRHAHILGPAEHGHCAYRCTDPAFDDATFRRCAVRLRLTQSRVF